MNFTPDKNVVRTLIVSSRDALHGATDYDFSVRISMTEPGYDYCFIKLKQFLVDEVSVSSNNLTLQSFFVTSDLGQKVYSTSKKKNFLGSFLFSQAFGDLKAINNPLIELFTIPDGVYNFKIVDTDGNVIQHTTALSPLSPDAVTLIFEVYFCKR